MENNRLEERITFHQKQMEQAFSDNRILTAHRHCMLMGALIAKRSPEKVRQMEVEKGLC